MVSIEPCSLSKTCSLICLLNILYISVYCNILLSIITYYMVILYSVHVFVELSPAIFHVKWREICPFSIWGTAANHATSPARRRFGVPASSPKGKTCWPTFGGLRGTTNPSTLDPHGLLNENVSQFSWSFPLRPADLTQDFGQIWKAVNPHFFQCVLNKLHKSAIRFNVVWFQKWNILFHIQFLADLMGFVWICGLAYPYHQLKYIYNKDNIYIISQ